jgi:hypothetical protein
MNDGLGMHGVVVAELRGPDGELKGRCVARNLITNIGDRVYGEQGCGIGSPAAKPTGAKLGAGSTAVAKSGSGSALTTYLSNSHQAITGGFPTSTLVTGKRDIVYQYLWAAGKATTASPITEAAIINDALADATSLEAATVSRVLLTGIGSKAAADSLTLTWTHTVGT